MTLCRFLAVVSASVLLVACSTPATRVVLLPQPDAVRIETQTATIGIRGTDFIVQADAQP